MLTAYQCRVVAYWTDGGLACPSCADLPEGFDDLDRDEQDELLDELSIQPIIQYGLDEYQSQSVDSYADEGECPAGLELDTDETCECLPAVHCDHCGAELEESYVDTYTHDDEAPTNPPVPRWVPCSSCHAGDGEAHRDDCPTLNRKETV